MAPASYSLYQCGNIYSSNRRENVNMWHKCQTIPGKSWHADGEVNARRSSQTGLCVRQLIARAHRPPLPPSVNEGGSAEETEVWRLLCLRRLTQTGATAQQQQQQRQWQAALPNYSWGLKNATAKGLSVYGGVSKVVPLMSYSPKLSMGTTWSREGRVENQSAFSATWWKSLHLDTSGALSLDKTTLCRHLRSNKAAAKTGRRVSHPQRGGKNNSTRCAPIICISWTTLLLHWLTFAWWRKAFFLTVLFKKYVFCCIASLL